MSEDCTLCGFSQAEGAGSATDESGGRVLYLCDWCIERLQQPRCCICGKRIVGSHKADYVVLRDSEEKLPYCEDCRSALFDPPIGGVAGGFSARAKYTEEYEKSELVENEMKYRAIAEGDRSK